MATIDAVASRGAERNLPPAKYSGGRSPVGPDNSQPTAAPQDRVQVSEAARSLARSRGADQPAELQLSPEMLRKLMAAPEGFAGAPTTSNRAES